jgi:ABC-type uncharacterized transport system permease subunit
MMTFTVQHLARAIRAEYLELPGLSLTRSQVQRLFSIDVTMTEAILAALVDVEFLVRTEAGRYVRADRRDTPVVCQAEIAFQAA